MDRIAGMQRIPGILVGIGTQLLFLFTVWHLFHFLNGRHSNGEPGSLWIDVLLTMQYAVPHSLLLLPSVKKRLTKFIPTEFYGSFYCVATCLGLLVTFFFWRSNPHDVWRLEGVPRVAAQWMFYAAWGSLLYSLSLTGLGYQTGLTQWWYWLTKAKQPRREFQPRSLYRFLRHPVYLSFMGLLWFTPTMTVDRLLLALIWTGYIFVGSYLKDERLAYFIGAPYREYQTRVAGYPFIFFGPLGRRHSHTRRAEPLVFPESLKPNQPKRAA
ncbi:MAG: hypothetical protein CMJ46_00355 [Planctomyces sp.]|nr:hypothetical protein [Planctomyces sp.]